MFIILNFFSISRGVLLVIDTKYSWCRISFNNPKWVSMVYPLGYFVQLNDLQIIFYFSFSVFFQDIS